jgi:hypothetical protein
LQTSVRVQATPSLQGVPAVALTTVHPPLPSHVTLVWHCVGAGHV